MGKQRQHRFKKNILVMFSLLTFIMMTLTVVITGALIIFMYHIGLLTERSRAVVLVIIAAVSILVGTVLSRLVGKKTILSIVEISKAAKEVSAGNFNVFLNEDIPIDELRELAHNFNIMAKELAGTEILRNDFVENVSHEFKTPLSAIEGYSTLLQRKNLSEEKRFEYTKRILCNTKRLSQLTGNILLLSRLENQELNPQKENFCLDEQLREVILALQEKWSEKEVRLDVDLDSSDYYGNRDLLFHVWENILSNAVKFVGNCGVIRVTLRRYTEFIKVCISDNGIGMNDETLRRVFEKFYQGDRSRSSHGNGLGMALSKRIVDIHSGKITVCSTEGKGTEFTVTLPLT